MRAQRIREGESRMEMQSAKWAAEGTVKGCCSLRNQGGTAGEVYTLVLDRNDNSVKGGLFYVPGRN